MSRPRGQRELEEAAHRAVAAAQRERRTQWLAWRAAQPARDLLEALDPRADDAFFYEAGEDAIGLAATGAAVCLEAEGAGRFRALSETVRTLSRALHVAGDTDAPPEAGPVFVGGFAFADAAPRGDTWTGFPASRLVLPRVLQTRRGDRAWSCVVHPVEPTDDAREIARAVRRATGDAAATTPGASRVLPDPTEVRLRPASEGAAYRGLVGRAVDAVCAGELEKVVIARALDVERDAPFDAVALLRGLRARHPGCALFAVKRSDAWLAGATPERLLRRRGRQALAVVLAGSAARGRSPEEDARLRRALVESKKEQAEHAIVVRAIREALAPLCHEVRAPEAPKVLPLGGVQHLWTPMEGALREPCDLLELAGRVHPTPAVAGSPREAALAWLADHEPLERGWYAGLVGWMTPEGDGELSAALRCALLRGRSARLFAGGGIVEGSRPRSEQAEVRLKWEAVLPTLLEL